MPPPQVIEFDNGSGTLIPFMLFTVVALATLNKKSLSGGFRRLAGAVCLRVSVGLVLAGLVMVAGAAYADSFSKGYFVRLRLEPERIVLSYQWPAADAVVAYKDVFWMDSIRKGGRRSGTRRLSIQTGGTLYQSYGFSELSEEEQAVIQELRARIEAQRPKREPQQPGISTNSPATSGGH